MASPRARSSRYAGPAEAPGPARGSLTVDDLLAERYRLLECVADDGPAALWRAHDEVLARPVAVKSVPTPNKGARDAAQPFLDAAMRAGGVSSPGLARVYDAAQEPRPGRGNDVAYVISEWVDGEPLDTHLGRVGALASLDAADITRQAADALTAAHGSGLVHGRLHPGNVIVSTSGRVRLLDTGIAAALHGDPATPSATPEGVAADTRDLGAVLYALLTRRWPAAATPQPAGSLAAAPVESGHSLTTRQLRAGVPRALDTVISRALDPGRLPALGPLRTPAALADATDTAVAGLRAEQAELQASEPAAPGRFRRYLPWGLAAAFVAVVGAVGWTLGLAVGDLPRRDNAVDTIVSTTEAPKPGVSRFPAVPLADVGIEDFDPLGKDHQEHPDEVRNAVDGDPATAWTTQTYKAFSGVKAGVGLLLDLRRPVALHTASVGFSAPGAHVELRVADQRPTGLATTRVVAASTAGKQVAALTVPAGTKAQWVVVWITRLPKDGDGFRVGVAELRIT